MNRCIVFFIACLLPIELAIQQRAYADFVSTQMILKEELSSDHRARIENFLIREDVRESLVLLGVSENEVNERIAYLSDEELELLASKIDTLPAGAGSVVGSVIGAVVLIFIILLITDILGLTRVFPFTRPVR
jgi:hypothetical protein